MQIDDHSQAIAEALSLPIGAVRRVLQAYLQWGDDARPDPRYLARHLASEEPAIRGDSVRLILSTYNLLAGLSRYCEAEISKFVEDVGAGAHRGSVPPGLSMSSAGVSQDPLGGMPRPVEGGDGQWSADGRDGPWPDEGRVLDEVDHDHDKTASEQADREAWAQGYRERLGMATARRDVDDVLAEMQNAWQIERRMQSMPPGISEIAEAIWSVGKPAESLLEMAARLAPEACEELGGPAGVLQEASALGGERWASASWVRQALRNLLVSEGVLAVRPSHGRPDVVIPGSLATVRKPVPDLSPREVRDLQQRTEDVGCTLRIELDEGRALDVVEELEQERGQGQEGGSRDRCYPMAVRDSMTRILTDVLLPELGRELKGRLLARANRREVEAVGEAYLHRLDALPLDEDELLAIDPGYGDGCRLVTVRRDGSLLDHGSFELIGAGIDPAQTVTTLRTLFEETEAHVVAIAVGEGHQELYCRVREAVRVEGSTDPDEEWEDDEEHEEEPPSMDTFLVDGLALDAAAGAPPLKESYPEADLRLRRCVVTARRLLDPFAAWSEVDPRAIAAAYDWTRLDASKLARQLDEVLRSELCWRGVSVNSAPEPLLSRIPGVDRSAALEIVRRRREQAPFRGRQELASGDLFDARSWEQCAGFLLVADDPADPLDACTIHPRDYELAHALVERLDSSVPILRERARVSGTLPKLDADAVAAELGAGVDRVRDLIQKIVGASHRAPDDRDPAEEVAGLPDEVFDELIPGMEVRGTVGDIVTYGAFIDIGTASPALLHISELAERYVPDPGLIVRAGDEIVARVLSVEDGGERVALSLRRDHRAGKSAGDGQRTTVRPARSTNATRKLIRSGTARHPAVNDEADRYPAVGDVIRGHVQRVVDYGAFIEFGLRRAGLLHRSQMTADPSEDPRNLLLSGDMIIARVIESNPQAERIGLTILDLPPSAAVTYEPVPGWENEVRGGSTRGGTQRRVRTSSDVGMERNPEGDLGARRRVPPAGGSRHGAHDELDTARFEAPAGPPRRSPQVRNLSFPDSRSDRPATFEEVEHDMIVHGKVTKTVSYGIFVDLGIDAPALIHISEIADEFVRDPAALVQAGEMLRAHVLRVDRDNRCVALTLRRDDAGRLI